MQQEKYIIVQAGGKGTRLKKLTRNKPKAIVSIENLPMIFHLFKLYPNAKFVIIGDYKCDVLERYLRAFADVDYKLVNSNGYKGTCAGISNALEYIPNDTPFMLIWSDLILGKTVDIMANDIPKVGLAQDFVCRWSYRENEFIEEASSEFGVAGLFVFGNKQQIQDVPNEGEFVRWLSESKMCFEPVKLELTKEYGLIEVVDKLGKMKCRPFNKLTIDGDTIIKEGVDEQGKKLAVRERAWYQYVKDAGFKNLPKIYELEPLKMSKVDGDTIYAYTDLDIDTKKQILGQIVDCLKSVHTLGGGYKLDKDSYDEAYIGKTLDRLSKVKDLVPFANDEYININGKMCKNVFFVIDKIKQEMEKYLPEKFVFIHGDCTFSNMMLDKNNNPVLIDPRGYFGNTELYGDVAYDWAKLYYSIEGNYDQFNLKNFDLYIKDDSVQLNIKSNRWEDVSDYYLELIKDDVCKEQIKLIHALIWLSLTTYAWDDYDSICGAFYNGVLLLNDCEFMKENKSNIEYFDNTMRILGKAIQSIDNNKWYELVKRCTEVIKSGGKIIASGLGKNVPICEKFVGTLNSFGIEARFLHTNTAVHGDLGFVGKNDIVFILSKSGNTEESIMLADYLLDRGTESWGLTCNNDCALTKLLKDNIIFNLENEGDIWDIAPNNSTTLFLIFLQGLAIELSKKLNIYLEEFSKNHPGGSIGKILKTAKGS